MKMLKLDAAKRNVTGRKVKSLRSKGVIPATVYGKTTKPISIQVSMDEFTSVFKQAGETGLISLTIDKEAYPVLVKYVARDPVSGSPIHAEFHRVNLREKIRANVPIILTGESQAVKEKTGLLLQLLNEIEVEALPTDLPEHVVVDISGLISVNDHIFVKDLTIPQNVTLLTDPEIMVVKISELVAPEPEPTPEPKEEGVVGEGEEEKEAEEKETAVKGEEGGGEEQKEHPEKPAEPPKKE